MRASSTKSGFTLIELLVVIAIIALLAAILFPIFARARENARRTSCQSNLKQMALGMEQYKQDYDSKYAPVRRDRDNPNGWGWQWDGGSGATGSVPWNDLLQPYLKNDQLFSCPSSRLKGFVNYFYNSNFGVGRGFDCQFLPDNPCIKNEAMIQSPTVVIMFGDGGRYNAGQVANCHTSTTADCPKNNSQGASPPAWSSWTDRTGNNSWASDAANAALLKEMQTRHLEGLNYAFADGHVKWLKLDKLTYDHPNAGNPTFNAVGVS